MIIRLKLIDECCNNSKVHRQIRNSIYEKLIIRKAWKTMLIIKTQSSMKSCRNLAIAYYYYAINSRLNALFDVCIIQENEKTFNYAEIFSFLSQFGAIFDSEDACKKIIWVNKSYMKQIFSPCTHENSNLRHHREWVIEILIIYPINFHPTASLPCRALTFTFNLNSRL